MLEYSKSYCLCTMNTSLEKLGNIPVTAAHRNLSSLISRVATRKSGCLGEIKYVVRLKMGLYGLMPCSDLAMKFYKIIEE